MKYTFELTKEQLRYINAIKAMICHGPRRSGRTFAMAYVFIEQAFENFGHSVRIYDHYLPDGNREYLFSMICNVFEQLDDNKYDDGSLIYQMHINRHERTIKITHIQYDERKYRKV